MGCGDSKHKALDESNRSRLQRGMLTEVVSVHRDGKEVYNRDTAPRKMYQHPSFADELPPVSRRNVGKPTTPTKDMRYLRAQLVKGTNEVQRRQGW
ncbi:unnamed protein product [Fusarium venenatum]|uniref:Uncharacterized protein n=1 Tax=Fusarium venenatum TaxID=56646 RepID=A0A2L2SS39_9HYPO|nr:uncharacterized protein FVRRES_13887 [Fusarium venenatum]CEI42098.1 unnamed protein product [Fusarium venenatum]